MSVWRQKALACAPELRIEFEAPDLTPYTVFMELLPITVQAHIDKDNEKLERIYDFAEWCFRQKAKDLWNAAAVSFYEHLGDRDETFSEFTRWIKKDIFIDIRGLLTLMNEAEKMKSLDKYYGWTETKKK
ncbi:MAG: hypothetical protein V4722_07050 [Bacteroidota bacterium]